MRFVIVTGMSGAGKSQSLKMLEDIGFYCVDNLPPALIGKFAELCLNSGSEMDKVALGIDIRGGKLFHELFDRLGEIKTDYEIMFLDASNESLVKRFKETRRSHPFASKYEGRIDLAIEQERVLLEQIKKKASYIIDTSSLHARELKQNINHIFLENKRFESLMISVVSFGFKYGIPLESDLVFDVRFIPNPYYIEHMKNLTGNDQEVIDFVLSWDTSTQFLTKLIDMAEFLIPNYIKEGKNQLVIGIGCTGGMHRSVTLANEVHKSLLKHGHNATINHRDIERDVKISR